MEEYSDDDLPVVEIVLVVPKEAEARGYACGWRSALLSVSTRPRDASDLIFSYVLADDDQRTVNPNNCGGASILRRPGNTGGARTRTAASRGAVPVAVTVVTVLKTDGRSPIMVSLFQNSVQLRARLPVPVPAVEGYRTYYRYRFR